jgi:putative serine protease PepD
MSDQHADRDEVGDAAPWWSAPGRDVWDAPEPSSAPQPTADRPPLSPSPYGAASFGAGPYDAWAPTDAYGQPRVDPPQPSGRGPGTGVLLVLALVVALVAGLAGGAAGYLLADRNKDNVTVSGASLQPAPARNVKRSPNSVPGVAAKVLPSVVQIKVETSQGQATGSGFVIDKAGVVVTNNHVVADAQGAVRLTFSDGTETTATVLGTSPSYDLAVLRVKAHDLPALPLGNSDSVVVGDGVLAVGSPLGLSGTVTSGIVSAKDRAVSTSSETGSGDSSYIDAIQTDAAINPGNSGGPLVNLNGEVIGVNSAIAAVSSGGLGGQSGNIGVGFAIPINQVRYTVRQLLADGKAEFPIIGASLDPQYDGAGARISATGANGQPPLVPGGPAEKAGVQPGDVVVAIDGKKVEDSAALIVAIRAHHPGEKVRLTLSRGGDTHDVTVTLAAHDG